MNKRKEIIRDLRTVTEDEDVIDIVVAFIDEVEGTFNEIATELSSFGISSLYCVETAMDIARQYGESLY